MSSIGTGVSIINEFLLKSWINDDKIVDFDLHPLKQCSYVVCID